MVSLYSIAFALLAVSGAVASPAGDSPSLEQRDAAITYNGKCSAKANTCRYVGQSGRPSICKCYVKKCSGDGKACHYDSYKNQCLCV
ncbi:hypothetical protein XA68_13599 [Ophiocordyceps unilateralis]|uniref:Antifungal protein n=1 Tax=Ophiocordyceps unilateralis TaxID=268505 RepID=A0A2A9PBV9_OPHUN|nr:hypothetical protein XA68_13599 [Ophiocordyceps unilateralis]